MAGSRNSRWRRGAVESFTRRETGEGARDLEGSARRQQFIIVIIAARRLIALLAVVRKAATLFSAVPHLPLPDLPDCLCQPYRALHRADRGPASHQPPARIPDRTIH